VYWAFTHIDVYFTWREVKEEEEEVREDEVCFGEK
jgi:hypothetical protein